MLKTHWLDDAGLRRRLTEQFADHGVAADRLELLGKTGHRQQLEEYNAVDLALDSFPYSGGLTTCEACWMGVPAITCPGETFASRHSPSHLSNVGLTDTITSDVGEYVLTAIQLASDLPRLAALRAGLRHRVAQSPLCDVGRFTGQLATALRTAWREHLRHLVITLDIPRSRTDLAGTEAGQRSGKMDRRHGTAHRLHRSGARARKLERGANILRQELAERPDDPFVLFNLGAALLWRRCYSPPQPRVRSPVFTAGRPPSGQFSAAEFDDTRTNGLTTSDEQRLRRRSPKHFVAEYCEMGLEPLEKVPPSPIFSHFYPCPYPRSNASRSRM